MGNLFHISSLMCHIDEITTTPHTIAVNTYEVVAIPKNLEPSCSGLAKSNNHWKIETVARNCCVPSHIKMKFTFLLSFTDTIVKWSARPRASFH